MKQAKLYQKKTGTKQSVWSRQKSFPSFKFVRTKQQASQDREAVWPDGLIGFVIFGHLEQWKFAQTHTNCPKVDSQLCQIQNKHQKIAKDFSIFAKMAKFRQIWPHWPGSKDRLCPLPSLLILPYLSLSLSLSLTHTHIHIHSLSARRRFEHNRYYYLLQYLCQAACDAGG